MSSNSMTTITSMEMDTRKTSSEKGETDMSVFSPNVRFMMINRDISVYQKNRDLTIPDRPVSSVCDEVDFVTWVTDTMVLAE